MNFRSTVVLVTCIWLGGIQVSGQILHPLFSTTTPEAGLVAISPNGQLGVSALRDAEHLVVFDLSSGWPVARLEAPPAAAFLAFDEKNDWLVAAGSREVVRWRLSDFRIRERYELLLQPEGETLPLASRFDYDPTRELLFRSVGSDLYCYSLRQEGQGKYLKRKTPKKEVGALRPAYLMQAPKREDLWVLDIEQGELRIIGLDYFRERRRLAVPGAIAMAVDNKRVAVLCREQEQYLVKYYDEQLNEHASYPLPARLPAGDTLKMAFTGRQMLSITGHDRVWDLSLKTGQLSSFELGHSCEAVFFLPDGMLAARVNGRLQIIGDRGRVLRQHRLTFSPLLLWDSARDSAFLLEGSTLRDEAGNRRLSLHPDDAFPLAAALRQGQLIVNGREGGLAHYDLASGKRRLLTESRKSGYARLWVCPENNLVAAWSCRNGAVSLIDLKSRKTNALLYAVHGKISALTYQKGRLYVGDSEGGVAVWSITGTPYLEDYHCLTEEPVEAIALSPDGMWASAGSKAGIVTCRMPCFEITARVPGHDNVVRTLRFAPSGTRLLSIAGDSMVKIWETVTGRLLENISLEEDIACDARYLRKEEDLLLLSSRGRLLARRGDLQIRGLVGRPGETPKLAPRALSSAWFRRAYFGGSQGARREDSPSYLTNEQRRIPPKEAELTVQNLVPGALAAGGSLRTAMSPDGTLTAVWPAASGEIVIWENASGTAVQRIAIAGREKWRAMSFWEHQPILILADDAAIEYWDARTGRLLKKLDYRAVSPGLTALHKEAGSDYLWGITEGGSELVQLNAWSGKVISKKRIFHPDNGLPETLYELAVSPAGGRLALQGEGGIYLYDTRKGEPLAFIRRRREESRWGAMTFSPDAHLLAVASPERVEIIVFDLIREAEFFRAPGEKVTFLDQRRLAIARNEAERGASVDIWDYLHGGPLGAVQVHPQRRLEGLEGHAGVLLTADADGRIKIWEGQSRHRPGTGVAAPAYELTEMFPLRPNRPPRNLGRLPSTGWLKQSR